MFILKFFKKIYLKINLKKKRLPECITDARIASELVYNMLNSNKPVMIGRFGSTELMNIVNYLGIVDKKNKNYFTYIKGEAPAWWWQENLMRQLQDWSGFFPPTKEKITQFCKMMIEDSKEVDILGSWLQDEKFMDEFMNYTKVHLRFLEPFWDEKPWTRVLKGKKVLVIHPFKNTIEKQYENRDKLFFNNEVLPEFKSLRVIKAVQSLGGNNEFKDWFEALEYMKNEIDKNEYDICLIGAGAYGFPLAAHVKRNGKKAVHMGGVLQLLFGIIGNRWEDQNYGVKEWGIKKGFYSNLMNEFWVRPHETEKPLNATIVEGACYW